MLTVDACVKMRLLHFYLDLSICISIGCIFAVTLMEGENTLTGKYPPKKDHFDGSHAFMISFNRLFYWGVASKWSTLRNSLKWLINYLDPPTLTVIIIIIIQDRQKALHFKYLLPSSSPLTTPHQVISDF